MATQQPAYAMPPPPISFPSPPRPPAMPTMPTGQIPQPPTMASMPPPPMMGTNTFVPPQPPQMMPPNPMQQQQHTINTPFPQAPGIVGGVNGQQQFDANYGAKTSAELERERAANEAILASMQGAANRYVRQEMAERLGLNEAEASNVRAHKPLEFHPRSPTFNVSVAILLSVTLFGLMPIIGSLSLTVGLLGAGCVYIADYLGYRKGSIMVLILALGFFQFSLILTNARHISNNMGTLFAMINTCAVNAVIIAAAVTQYRWVQVTFPELVVLLERFVLVAAPISGLPSILSTCIALSGSRIGAFPFALACIALQYMFAARRSSSFLRKAVDDDMEINAEDVPEDEDLSLPALERETAALLTFVLGIAPCVAYLFLQSDPHMEPAMIFMTIMGLLCINVVYLLWDPEVSLWFMRPTSTTMTGMLRSDPLGLWPLMVKSRPMLLFCGYLALMEAGIYRLLHSRFQYLFVGVPKPFNAIMLLLVGFLVTVIIALMQRVLTAKARQGTNPVTKDRVMILLLSMVATVMVAVVAGMPPFFHPMSALAASSFNAYLLDRRNGTNFMLFVMTSSLLLLWWMYRTFSFIIMDLRVLTDATVVPTPVLTISILWCYLLGALSFGLSFSENKRPMTVALIALAFKVGWVEHVLYSQRETGVYPGWLVFATTGAGVATCLRLRKNEVISVEGAAFVIAVFIAKVYTFLTEVVGAPYLEDDINGYRALFVAFGFVAALVSSFLVALMELKRREDTSNTIPPSDIIVVFVMTTMMALICAYNSILRGFVDAMDGQWGSISKDADALLGAAILLTAILTWPLLKRYAKRNATADLMAPMAVGLGLVVIHPLAFFTTELIDDGKNFNTTPIGRLFLLGALVLVALARVIPFKMLPAAVRFGYWVVVSLLSCIALHLILYPASSIGFSASMFVFVAMTAIVVDICHYHKAGAESWVVYAVSVVAMIAAFVTLASHLGSQAKTIEEWEMHDTARIILIGIGACVNMLLSVFVKFRLLGMPLLPKAIGLTDSMVQHIGVIGNYATLLATCMLLLLNVWANEGDVVVSVVAPSFLLMLVDDGVLFFELSRGSFRYFPPVLTILVTLWAQLLNGAYATFQRHGLGSAVWDIIYAFPTLPSHLSLLFLLWHAGTKRGGSKLGGVILFVIIDFFCIFCATRPTVQWMAIVGLTGQMVRLYVGEFWTQAVDTIL